MRTHHCFALWKLVFVFVVQRTQIFVAPVLKVLFKGAAHRNIILGHLFANVTVRCTFSAYYISFYKYLGALHPHQYNRSNE